MDIIFDPKLDIFESRDDALVNPVNTDRRLAAQRRAGGLAGVFARRCPQNIAAYSNAVLDGSFRTGTVHAWQLPSGRWIINLPTKGANVYEKASLAYIEPALDDLTTKINNGELMIKSISVPRLGAGLGGLDFADVLPLIQAAAQKTPHVQWRVLSEDPT